MVDRPPHPSSPDAHVPSPSLPERDPPFTRPDPNNDEAVPPVPTTPEFTRPETTRRVIGRVSISKVTTPRLERITSTSPAILEDNAAGTPKKVGGLTVQLANVDSQTKSTFVEPLPKDTKLGLTHVEQQLVTSVLKGEVSRKDIQGILHTSEPLNSAYPGIKVPEEFMAEQPNVLFTPPALSTHPSATEAARYAESVSLRLAGIAHTPITDPDKLASQLLRIRSSLPPYEALGLLKSTVKSFVDNLELHRLTADPDGQLRRFTDTPQKDMPDSIIEPGDLSGSKMPWTTGVHPALQPLVNAHWTTWWHRTDAESVNMESYGGNRATIETTVGTLLRTNMVSLDRIQRRPALIAFRI